MFLKAKIPIHVLSDILCHLLVSATEQKLIGDAQLEKNSFNMLIHDLVYEIVGSKNHFTHG